MNTRTNQTVNECELLASVTIAGGASELQIRSLFWGRDVVRLIIVDRAEVEMCNYQINILAEARYAVKSGRLSFVCRTLRGDDLELCKDVMLSVIKERTA
ncbi:hypothetical protein VCHA53O466_50509 [Vibrio chagasii]|nr:hypothetical protein VCHA53O466_50509 [Vibrio chagasii]